MTQRGELSAPAGQAPHAAHDCCSLRIPVLQTLLPPKKRGRGYRSSRKRSNLSALSILKGSSRKKRQRESGVSRKTAWRDLHEARRKIADALVNGKGINMAGCTKAADGRCPKCPRGETART